MKAGSTQRALRAQREMSDAMRGDVEVVALALWLFCA
jgi:hypothetical protein